MTDLKSAPGPRDADISALIDQALAEDVGDGDITAAACVDPDQAFHARIVARQSLVVCGMEIAVAVFHRLDGAIEIAPHARDGQRLAPGEALMQVQGAARPILTAERTALNFLQHLSGIATLTAAYTEQLKGSQTRLLDTRKTIPGLRRLAKYACACGGAVNHRMGLFDAVMIKDNHIALAGSVEAAVRRAKDAGHDRIQVECDTLDQVQEAITAGADRLLLDNMSPRDLRHAVAIVQGRAVTEASGGVNLDNLRDVAESRVDYVSVGAITHSAPAADIGLDAC